MRASFELSQYDENLIYIYIYFFRFFDTVYKFHRQSATSRETRVQAFAVGGPGAISIQAPPTNERERKPFEGRRPAGRAMPPRDSGESASESLCHLRVGSQPQCYSLRYLRRTTTRYRCPSRSPPEDLTSAFNR